MKKLIFSLIAITPSVYSMDQELTPGYKRPRYATRSQIKNNGIFLVPGAPAPKRQKLETHSNKSIDTNSNLLQNTPRPVKKLDHTEENIQKSYQALCEEFALIVPMEDVIMRRTKSLYHTSDFAMQHGFLLIKQRIYLNQNELNAKTKEIKLRFFNNFIERYNYDYDWVFSPGLSMLNYSDLQARFLTDTLDPHHPIHSLLLKEYAETMAEWNSNLETTN